VAADARAAALPSVSRTGVPNRGVHSESNWSRACSGYRIERGAYEGGQFNDKEIRENIPSDLSALAIDVGPHIGGFGSGSKQLAHQRQSIIRYCAGGLSLTLVDGGCRDGKLTARDARGKAGSDSARCRPTTPAARLVSDKAAKLEWIR